MSKRKLIQVDDENTKPIHGGNEDTCLVDDTTTFDPFSNLYDEDDPCHKPYKKQLAFLDVRATAMGLANNFENGLRDANEMIRLSPKTTEGYLRLGDLHSMRSNHKRARDTFDEGYTKATDRNEEERAILKQRSESSSAKLDIRVDIVGRLPGELLPIIFKGFDMEQLLDLLDISVTWRNRLSGEAASSLWSKMNISRDIYLDCAFDVDQCFLRGLEQLANTLTSINIEYGYSSSSSQFQVIPFKTILVSCYNLEEFIYRHNDAEVSSDDVGEGPEEGDPISLITTLVLQFEYIPEVDLDDILSFCPYVQTLLITTNCQTRKILGPIQWYCKRLKYASLNPISPPEPEIYELPENPNWKPGDGLRYLNVGNVENIGDLVPILEEYGNPSLEVLAIEFNSEEPSHDLEYLNNMKKLMSVQKLSIMYAGYEDMAAVDPLLEKLPNLTHLRFLEAEIVEDTQYTYCGKEPNCKINLEGIVLYRCPFVTDEMMYAIAHLPTLREIHLEKPGKEMTKSGFRIFCRSIKETKM
ncbi:hypothetical protein BDA99DRAFT_536387 [Phascolomyces articulosus]|uniref:F-box domain-containing protein n=1 Tax=Phascolomyces articulosus TaxID=60185 RepID=A0AAD5PF06_9FUNG|nr:hypothetical protein BDA99DRAFT_536387 [Phascolomyces articulosus]